MATAKKLPSGSWRCLVYDYTDANGKRKYKSITNDDPSPAGKRMCERDAAEYAALQSSALSAAKRGYVDTIIDAKDTRKYLIGAFEMLFTKREDRPGKKHGTV